MHMATKHSAKSLLKKKCCQQKKQILMLFGSVQFFVIPLIRLKYFVNDCKTLVK